MVALIVHLNFSNFTFSERRRADKIVGGYYMYRVDHHSGATKGGGARFCPPPQHISPPFAPPPSLSSIKISRQWLVGSPFKKPCLMKTKNKLKNINNWLQKLSCRLHQHKCTTETYLEYNEVVRSRRSNIIIDRFYTMRIQKHRNLIIIWQC